jgi:integrase
MLFDIPFVTLNNAKHPYSPGVFMGMPRPRPTLFEVRKPTNGKWRIVGFVNGVRKQFWFKTEKAAKQAVKDRNSEIVAHGTQVTLDPVNRMRALNAIERLSPFSKTIYDAVDHYVRYLKEHHASVPFSTLAIQVRAEFKRRLEKNEVSERHAESLNETLRKLEARFDETLVSEIRTEDIREWFQSLPLATKTKNKHKGYANQVFNLAVDFGYATVNPVSRIKPLRKRYSEEDKISILSAEETERLFRAADQKIIPFLTLSFFCGIRRATLERLDWSDVKFDEARVVVPKHKSKNQSRYRVTLSENALEWLSPHVKESGSILVPATAINRAGASFGSPSPTATRSLIKEAAASAGVNIPDNAGRHTFISMHVAHYESIDKTALEADNSPAVIKSNYLDIVTREEAAKYWRIVPA